MKEIVIKMSDEVYKFLEKRIKFGMATEIEKIVWNGKVLPKGHGRLIDADAVLEEPFGNTYKDIDIAETIIEADKGEEE